MSPLVLFHVVFPGKCLIAHRAVDSFFTSVLFAVPCGVSRGRKGSRAPMGGSVWTGMLILFCGRWRCILCKVAVT